MGTIDGKLTYKLDTGVIGNNSGAAVVFNNDLMYLASSKGFLVWNVKDAKNPAKVGQPIEAGVLGGYDGAAMVVNGDRLYLAGGKGGIRVMDISNALNDHADV